MKRSYKYRYHVLVCITGCILFFFPTAINYRSHARSQNNDRLVESGIRLGAGLNTAKANGIYGEHNLEKLTKKDRIIYDLKLRERELRLEREMLLQEISLARKLAEKTLASASDGQAAGVTIEKVKRVTGGKPEKTDMMVGVVQIEAVWKQIDYILDKLDEITESLSERG